MKTTKKIVAIVLALVMVLSFAACGETTKTTQTQETTASAPAAATPAPAATAETPAAPAATPSGEKETIELITGTQGGAYYIMASAIATLMEQYSDKYTVSVISSSAVTVETILKLQSGVAHCGFGVSGQVFGAYADQMDETTKGLVGQQCPKLRLLAGAHAGEIHLIVKDNSGIESVADVAGKKISVSNVGTGANIEMVRMLRVAGIDGKYTGVNSSMQESVDALKDGAVDVAQVTSGWPAAVVQDAMTGTDFHFLRIDESVIDACIAEAPYLMKTVIPAGTYPEQDEDYVTLSIPNAIYVGEDTPDEMVEALCDIIFNHHDELVATYAQFAAYTPENTLSAAGAVPLHPAAEKFLSEN